ncbi:hypothetical protein BBF96_06070 [Anoxybacter fermentans]|uniref:Uncharacterized protein n=1 Tax=Anoxybacter fermentans TaxID=1323375 RepID=A0A3S9SXM4_9FIRM|nr:hypothetical protein [Anoxybacter fermentans]AZR72998.1 hypothetical protein BBF96_06070 [Anoxybacter fermentans]
MNTIYIPMFAEEEISIKVQNQIFPVQNKDGWIQLSDLVNQVDLFSEPVVIQVNKEDLMLLDFNSLLKLYREIELLNAVTCLETYVNRKGQIQPSNFTSYFDIKKENVILFMEFNNMIDYLPLNISLFNKEKQCLYSFFGNYPTFNKSTISFKFFSYYEFKRIATFTT